MALSIGNKAKYKSSISVYLKLLLGATRGCINHHLKRS
ncbi:hypothetical protein EBME_1857 [bacterium endosymbiont of Mortierella elongata FMR23-6]|nr:hypothetical protein EBME_1857 [bacterium endosymbiont of Mortierella elongata FMR23-6]